MNLVAALVNRTPSSPKSPRRRSSGGSSEDLFQVSVQESEVRISREDLVQSVAKRVARDDSFFTLPFTVVQLIFFMVLVDKHLRVYQRQEMESALQEWVLGSSSTLTGPFVAEHVADRVSFWDWLESSGLPAIYGGHVDRSTGVPFVELASTSVLLGDAQLWQRRTDGSESAEWLLHTAQARADLRASPGAFLGTALNATRQLRAAGWLDDNTAEVQLRFATYCERASMFTLTEVIIDLSDSGVVHPRVASTAAMMDSYPEIYVYVLDAVYMLLLLYKFRNEAHEILLSLQLGCDGFIDYWSIWNVVDWTDVMLGAMGCGFWISCCFAMQAEALHALVSEGDPHMLQTDVMGLSITQLDEVHSSIRTIRRSFIELHLVFAANMIAIMAKFFKAFEANPRLKVVTATLGQSFKDIAHFLIVFMTVFLSFAIIGHVLFGGDLVEFYTTSTAINTGFYVLMGEFAWYVDIQHHPTENLPSGMPFVLVNIWFFMYMFFVLLVLLNMLLAIILAHYTNVTQSNSGSLTLWQQCKEYIRWRVATQGRGYIQLPHMRLLLENDDDPAHPGDAVTAESLRLAFPKMPKKQGDFLMHWLLAEKIASEADVLEEVSVTAEINENLVQHIQLLVRELGTGLESTAARIARIESVAVPGKAGRVNI